MQILNLQRSLKKQKGAAVLLVSIVLLVGVTLVTIFAARVGVMDQRIAGNEYRHKEAKAAADAALDQAASFIANNTNLYEGTVGGTYPWVACTGVLATKFPCQNGATTYDLAYDGDLTTTTSIESLQDGTKAIELNSGISADSYLTYTNSSSVGNILNAIGKGSSLDGTGDAYAQVSYTQITLLTPGKVPPIMTPMIKLSGSFTIVADPNGGGEGVPISAWISTIDTTGGAGSWQTCQLGSYRDGADICSETKDDTVTWKDCGCVVGETLSESGTPHVINYDLVEVGPGAFPDSTFRYLFPNMPDFATLRDSSIPVKKLTTCTNLVSETSGFTEASVVTVDGDCDIPAGSIVGSRDGPVLLVVSGELKINANSDFYGIALGMTKVSLNGTATVHGSLLAEDATNLSTGGYTQVYDPFVLDNIAKDLETFGLAKRKYSWIDIQP